MADSNTPTLGLIKIEVGASRDTWGTKTNQNCDTLDNWAAAINAWLTTLDAKYVALHTRLGVVEGWFPRGVIVAWAGDWGAIPAGWQACDGTNGTPDLRDRFIVGAGPAKPRWYTGGASTQYVTVSWAGDHAHGWSTGQFTLGIDHIPPHGHVARTDMQGDHSHDVLSYGGTVRGGGSTTAGWNNVSMGASGPADGSEFKTNTVGAHVHTVTLELTGGGQSHGHGINVDGGHNHWAAVPTEPPWYAQIYIMRV